MNEPKLKIVATPATARPRLPLLSLVERRDYQAAWRIAQMQANEIDYACPSTLRSRRIDRMAEMIIEEMKRT